MAARIKVIFAGNEYISKATDEMTAEKMKEAVYAEFSRMDKMTLETEIGFIVFGKDVVQGSVLVFEEI